MTPYTCDDFKKAENRFVYCIKTKILIFSDGGIPQDQIFLFKGENLESVNQNILYT